MSHVDEQSLELYVLDPDSFGSEEQKQRAEIREHVQQCLLCRSIVEYFHSFYADMRNMYSVSSPHVDWLVQSLFPSERVIQFKPFKVESDERSRRYTTVLAALTEQSPQRFHTVATLASKEQGALVRIIHDQSENVFKLYILSRDPHMYNHAIVSFPELPAELVTNASGTVIFNLPKNTDPKQLSTTNCLLSPVVEEFHLSEGDLISLREGRTREMCSTQVDIAFRILVSFANEKLSIRIDETEKGALPKIRRILVTEGEKTGILIDMENRKGECRCETSPQKLTIRLYC